MFDNFFQRFFETLSENYLDLLAGLKNTLLIAILALCIGIFIGTIISTIKVTPKKKNNYFLRFLEKLADLYVVIVRGTPVVVQLLLLYFALLAPLRIPALIVAILVFGLNSGAYVSEIMRSGILAVDDGQMEAGRSLGLSYGATMGKIILPQAVKNIIPTLGNEFITLLKETSVAGFITVIDVTMVSRHIVAAKYDALVPYIILALIYLLIVYIVTLLLNVVEGRLRKSDRS